MSPENFCYWLQGWFELNKTIDHRQGATPETLKMIEDHLALVLKKETPARNVPVGPMVQPPWLSTQPALTC